MPGAHGASDGPPDLDDWLGEPVVRTCHRRAASAGPDALWAAASSVRLDETRTLGRLVQWRIPGTDPRQTFRTLFARPPFVVLDEGPRHSVSGLCGRIWTLKRDYPHLDGREAFLAWKEPGTVRVVFGHWVEEGRDGGSILVSEARVQPVDAHARFTVSLLWRTVRVFERLIGGEALALAARRAADGSASEASPS